MMDAAGMLDAQKFCDAWRAGFSAVLEPLGAASLVSNWIVPPERSSESVLPESARVASWFKVRGGLQGAVLCLCDKTVAVQFAQLLQSEPCDPTAEFSELHRDGFAEFIRQVAAHVSTHWKQETNNEVELLFDITKQTIIAPEQTASLQLKSDKFSEVSLQLFLDNALCAALRDASLSKSPDLSAEIPDEKPGIDPLASNLAGGSFPNLALLLDVELEATIRFGQRDMLLREVYGLMPGAVVELNQLVNEPAELLVAGRLIARGEVVVVDGNFGLRITEVAVAGQRAALLAL